MDKPKFLVDFCYESWKCGDGCCSDSWYNIIVFKDGERSHSVNDCRACLYNEEDAWKWAHNEIQEYFELEKDSYDLEISY